MSEHHGHRKSEDHDGPSGPGAEEERHPGEEQDLREAEQEGRDEIVARNEWPYVRGVRSRRHDMVETGGQPQMQAPDDEERRERSAEAAPHVLPGGQARSVDDLPHPEFRIPDQHEAGSDRQEPDAHGGNQDRLEHALGGDGGNVRPESPAVASPLLMVTLPWENPKATSARTPSREPVGRTPQRRGQLPAGDGGPPGERGHDSVCCAASDVSWPSFEARFRMRSR